MEFLKVNLSKLKTENAEGMPLGFEVAFPSLQEMGWKINLQLRDQDSPILQDIYARICIKLDRREVEQISEGPEITTLSSFQSHYVNCTYAFNKIRFKEHDQY
ncbi:hypothetical protein FEM48_Zijuj10G0148600 [Ziziphus jujuba var. spinosa]|uniref:Uncharacterized protein n=1 Tax=Ziziphus jujuba var. spinosa TaxID=714518 RepID=A0A978UP14_ZIZJJ|nr:hypothetical protein FEM48_Zijuj10G0148600 [Ziziphus jujuba var. spinosa]